MRRGVLSPANVFMALGALAVVGLLVWRGAASGAGPGPSPGSVAPAAAVLDTAVLVFREGLEAVITLAVITAGLARRNGAAWRPVAAGGALALLATLATWWVVVGLLALIAGTVPELDVQAATGLVAVIVLVVVMNWFFHRVYWEGWLALHSRKRREFTAAAGGAALRGLALLGFASVYREGFEVVLFLQGIRMQAGPGVVLAGAALGLGLTVLAGLLTFAAHRRLPYQRMLLATGGMLGVVFVVMVGEQVQEMQQAGWLGATALGWLHWPAWLDVWLSLSPDAASLIGQGAAAALVIGAYAAARRRTRRAAARPRAGLEGAVAAPRRAPVEPLAP